MDRCKLQVSVTCRLTRVPAEVSQLCELKVLSAAYNKMVQIAEEVGTLLKLEKLNLSHNW